MLYVLFYVLYNNSAKCASQEKIVKLFLFAIGSVFQFMPILIINKPLALVQPPEFKEYEEWKWRGVGSLSVFLSIQDVRDSLKLGPGSRPGQDMSYHDNDLPSLRNINTHQQTWELQRQKYSRGGDWNIQRGLGDWTWFL